MDRTFITLKATSETRDKLRAVADLTHEKHWAILDRAMTAEQARLARKAEPKPDRKASA
jgi:hypothetical protein